MIIIDDDLVLLEMLKALKFDEIFNASIERVNYRTLLEDTTLDFRLNRYKK
jgi:hypothetical protein